MRIVVTGAAGRFGAVLAARLARSGHDLLLLDRVAPKFELPPGAVFEIDDLTQTARLRERFAGAQGVAHLAAIPSPMSDPPEVVFDNNVTSAYHVLLAAATTGVTHVCMASSINATGAAFSRRARHDYLPVDEAHPTYNEDAYSLSKWVGESAADSIARLHDHMTISSLRLHGLGKIKDRERKDARLFDLPPDLRVRVANHLWGYVDIDSAADAAERALHATFKGHEVFFIASHRTVFPAHASSAELLARHFPGVPLRAEVRANAGLYNCDKAARLLGWTHRDS
jgi:nucleoside-diphosphate-sugar epimerase